MPTCPKCGHRHFTMTTIEPANSRYKMNALHCTNISCQAIVGVSEYFDTGSLIKKQEKELEDLKRHMARVESGLHRVEQYLAHLSSR